MIVVLHGCNYDLMYDIMNKFVINVILHNWYESWVLVYTWFMIGILMVYDWYIIGMKLVCYWYMLNIYIYILYMKYMCGEIGSMNICVT